VIRKICVVTGSRADYGLLGGLLTLLGRNRLFQVRLIVTGSHLSPRYGNTWREIARDGFRIDARVKIGDAGDTEQGVADSTSQAITGLARVFGRIKPDVVLVLGDRFEALAAAMAALFCRLPIAHIHGGETTEGAMDEAIRHAITKMSHLHFVSTPAYRRRVIQLGEAPGRVFVVGALGLDGLRGHKIFSRQELEKKLDLSLAKKNLLVTFHPATLSPGESKRQLEELLAALKKMKDTLIIFTMPNADMESWGLCRLIQKFVRRHPQARAFRSLGQQTYFSCLRHFDVVVGNSSSGILEAPSFRIPSVNVGDRQRGRIQARSTITCEPRRGKILAALRRAISPAFRRSISSVKNPYDQGGAAPKILQALLRQKKKIPLQKNFYDL